MNSLREFVFEKLLLVRFRSIGGEIRHELI